MKKQVLFVCIFNVKRSVIAAHLFRRAIEEKETAFADAIEVSSAGFIGVETSQWFKNNGIPYPDPLFERTPSAYIRSILLKRGIDLSKHRSRPLNKDILNDADLIIPLLNILKRDIVADFPEYEKKIVLPNELIKKNKNFFWEDTSNVPNDAGMFEFAHNDPQYVTTVIDEIGDFIANASTGIINRVFFQNTVS